MFKMFYSIQNINNGALQSRNAMPQKDSTSDGQSSFEMARKTYLKTNGLLVPPVSSNPVVAGKQWYGNRDASQVTANRRNVQVGKGSMNPTDTLLSFTTYKVVNTTNDALRRVRAGGAVAPPKKAASTHNAITPRYAPALSQSAIIGIKNPYLFH